MAVRSGRVDEGRPVGAGRQSGDAVGAVDLGDGAAGDARRTDGDDPGAAQRVTREEGASVSVPTMAPPVGASEASAVAGAATAVAPASPAAATSSYHSIPCGPVGSSTARKYEPDGTLSV